MKLERGRKSEISQLMLGLRECLQFIVDEFERSERMRLKVSVDRILLIMNRYGDI